MYKLLNFTEFRDDRGALIAFESAKNIPFGIQRTYIIYDTIANIARGFHAHKSLQQVLVCIKGSCNVHLADGINHEVVRLSSPKTGLYISGYVWREMNGFSEDCVLMVFADQYYHEKDYIRDYKEFLKRVSNDT